MGKRNKGEVLEGRNLYGKKVQRSHRNFDYPVEALCVFTKKARERHDNKNDRLTDYKRDDLFHVLIRVLSLRLSGCAAANQFLGEGQQHIEMETTSFTFLPYLL